METRHSNWIRVVGLLFAVGLVPGVVGADEVTSGTATLIGEPAPLNPKEAGRSQIKICGKVSGAAADLRQCSFQLTDLGFEVVTPGGIFDELPARGGGKATEVSFQSDQRQRPTLLARVKSRGNGSLEFCVTVDRAIVSPAPSGISTEPCVDGETADVPLEFDLNCDEGLISFSQAPTWRVPIGQCPADFPNMRTP